MQLSISTIRFAIGSAGNRKLRGSHVISHDSRIVAHVWSQLKLCNCRISDVSSSFLATGNRRRVGKIIYFPSNEPVRSCMPHSHWLLISIHFIVVHCAHCCILGRFRNKRVNCVSTFDRWEYYNGFLVNENNFTDDNNGTLRFRFIEVTK